MRSALGNSRSNATGLAVVSACLLTVGLVAVASAGANLDRSVASWRFWESAFGRQAVFSITSFLALLAVSQGSHRLFKWRPGCLCQPALLLYGMTIFSLVAALIPGIGIARKGARRWLQIGPDSFGISFQPSELAKVVLIIMLAALLARRWQNIRSFWKGVVPACLVIGLFVGLVGIEDFGTAALLAGVGGGMLVVAGSRLWHLVLVGLPGVAALLYLVIREPYRVERLTAFLDIWSDPRGAGYHPIQSLVAVASGGLFGKGPGAGVQKYGYLPESRSDFILGVICEETGMVGAVCVMALFALLIVLGWRIVNRSDSVHGRLVAFGVTAMFGMQALINIAVVLVVAPTKGISLPLVSAGGSGVVFLGIAMGLLISVGRESETKAAFVAKDVENAYANQPSCETCLARSAVAK